MSASLNVSFPSMKSIEKNLISGAIQGLIVFGTDYGLKSAGIGTKTQMTKGVRLLGSVIISEFIIDYADSKGWLPRI